MTHDQWPKTTPTGHTYVEPRTYAELRHEHANAALAAIECWNADECPPEPTWEMVGLAHREVERIRSDRDEWKARAEAAEPRTAVTRDEVWRVVAAHDPGDDEMALCRANRLTDAVCDLFGVVPPCGRVLSRGMTHDQWMQKHTQLMGDLRELVGKRDELEKHREHIPGPVLTRRLRELDDLHMHKLDELRELVELDESGAVS